MTWRRRRDQSAEPDRWADASARTDLQRQLHAAMKDEIAVTRADDDTLKKEIAEIRRFAPRAPMDTNADSAGEDPAARRTGVGGPSPRRHYSPRQPDGFAATAMALTTAGGISWTVVTIVKDAAHEWVVLTGAALMAAQVLVLAAYGQRKGS